MSGRVGEILQKAVRVRKSFGTKTPDHIDAGFLVSDDIPYLGAQLNKAQKHFDQILRELGSVVSPSVWVKNAIAIAKEGLDETS